MEVPSISVLSNALPANPTAPPTTAPTARLAPPVNGARAPLTIPITAGADCNIFDVKFCFDSE